MIRIVPTREPYIPVQPAPPRAPPVPDVSIVPDRQPTKRAPRTWSKRFTSPSAYRRDKRVLYNVDGKIRPDAPPGETDDVDLDEED